MWRPLPVKLNMYSTTATFAVKANVAGNRISGNIDLKYLEVITDIKSLFNQCNSNKLILMKH